MTIGAGTIGATPVGGVQRRRGEIALTLSAGVDRDTARTLTARIQQLARQLIAVAAAVESSAATGAASQVRQRAGATDAETPTAGATDRSQQTASAADNTRQTSGSASRETAAPAASSSDQEE